MARAVVEGVQAQGGEAALFTAGKFDVDMGSGCAPGPIPANLTALYWPASRSSATKRQTKTPWPSAKRWAEHWS